MRSNDCKNFFHANSASKFIPKTCCGKYVKNDKREPGLLKEVFRCTEMLCLCSKTYCCYNSVMNKTKFSSKGLSKSVLEENRSADESCTTL